MYYNSHLYCTIFGAALQDICGAVFFIPIFREIN
nr:MAG TPA: Tumor necrosis factor receptor superfamily, complex, MEMBRANE PROTEIN [Caudoviricetes sp.]